MSKARGVRVERAKSPTPKPASLSKGAKLLNEIAATRGMTVTALGLTLGLWPTRIASWARGSSQPNVAAAFLLEDNLGIPARAWTLDANDAA